MEKRIAYTEMFIKDIDSDTLRCRICGKVIEKKETSFLLDDGTGIIEIVINEDISKVYSSLDMGKDIMIFGKVITIENTPKIFADIVIDASFNVRYYRKIITLWKEMQKVEGGINENSD